jgi:hypothetical protein
MYDDGLHGDGAAGDLVYGYIFQDGFPDPTLLAAQVEATDNSGHVSVSPLSPESVYIFAGDPSMLYINELMADNATTLADESGEFDDWFEIYNGGDEPVWLGDKFLTDNLDNPSKWPCPDYAIQPGEYLIIWADEDGGQGQFHTNFKLSKDGEEIGLFDSEANGFALIDQVIFDQQQTDISYGRDPDGGEDWIFYVDPTPGISNELSVIVDPVLGRDQLIVFPNPAAGNFIYLSKVVDFTVFDGFGQIISHHTTTNRLDISGFSPGLYLLLTDEGIVTRFVIQ